jgi:putative methyltransferase (TIGR04325 family)
VSRSWRAWLPARWRAKPARPLTYSEPYPSWQEACRHAGSYADAALFEGEYRAARAVREGRAPCAVFSVPQTKPVYRFSVASSLLAIAGEKGGFAGQPVHVLDVGGGLGLVYDQHRLYLDALPRLQWSVVDQPHFVQCGRAEFAGDRLRFFDTIAEARAQSPVDVALMVSSLEYFERPYDALGEMLGIANIVFALLHTTQAPDDEFRVQTRHPPYVPSSMPLHFLSVTKLRGFLESHGYRCVVTAQSADFYWFRRAAAEP